MQTDRPLLQILALPYGVLLADSEEDLPRITAMVPVVLEVQTGPFPVEPGLMEAGIVVVVAQVLAPRVQVTTQMALQVEKL